MVIDKSLANLLSGRSSHWSVEFGALGERLADSISDIRGFTRIRDLNPLLAWSFRTVASSEGREEVVSSRTP